MVPKSTISADFSTVPACFGPVLDGSGRFQMNVEPSVPTGAGTPVHGSKIGGTKTELVWTDFSFGSDQFQFRFLPNMNEPKIGYPYPPPGAYQGPPPVMAPFQYYPPPPPPQPPKQAGCLEGCLAALCCCCLFEECCCDPSFLLVL
ncbi:hypothetical protein JCGZ_09919 [Jatropha curcas]|uniref:Cysteine-rich transmembrane domain-containing protein n=1 Tax=Jatropha curcas TaxID=180498 RepID=A0A067KIK0_JATCU|nr:hypothetical protein JCGZ_09919 [Jatropha curcas]